MRLACFLMIIGLGACTPFPQIYTAEDPNAPTPRLVPLSEILAQAGQSTAITPASVTNLNARIAALNARAVRLRGPLLSRATRTRMQKGVGDAALR